MIDRYLRGEDLQQPAVHQLPATFVAPVDAALLDAGAIRLKVPHAPIETRRTTFMEVEGVVDADAAIREARRCLRCDLEFTEDESGNTVASRSGEGGR